jgi:glycerol-3-phosphate dehydrogenase
MNPKDSFLFGSIFIDAEKEKDMYDVVIIGAGVSGCAVARELSRYQVSVCVVDKCEDVCCGTSKTQRDRPCRI